MNKKLKRILLGLIVWAVPFIASFFVWDTQSNAPSVSYPWFYALMGVTGALGFGIAAYYQFRGFQRNPVKEGWVTGITWYLECSLLDLIFLVGFMGMTLPEYSHLLLSYLSPLILAVTVGYVRK